MKNKKLIGQLEFIKQYECKTDDERKAIDKAKRIIQNEFDVRDWLSTFNTSSATECYTAVQRLKAEVEE